MERVKIVFPTLDKHIMEEIDTDKIYLEWGDTKEIKLSEVLNFILNQIEQEDLKKKSILG